MNERRQLINLAYRRLGSLADVEDAAFDVTDDRIKHIWARTQPRETPALDDRRRFLAA